MSKAQLYQKILKVMQDIEYLQKDDSVSTGFNKPSYKAISEEKVTSSVRASLVKQGLVILPVEQEHLREPIIGADGTVKGSLSTVNTKYEICDTETGECKILASSGTGADTQDKGVGKAMTYSYKYLLLRTFAIPTGEDPDKVSNDTLDEMMNRNKPPKDEDLAAIEKASKDNVSQIDLASEGQVKMLNAKASAAGFKPKDKDSLMKSVSELINKTISSFNEVGKKDVNTVAKWLDEAKSA